MAMIGVGSQVPTATFVTRVRDDSLSGDNPFRWQEVASDQIFAGRRVVLFALPGAFTPTCSSTHLPRYDELHDAFRERDIDDVICLSVNDAFVMFQWGRRLGVRNVRLLPDGNGEFTRKMGMLVKKTNLGFGLRSWRYAMVVRDGMIEAAFVEPGYSDDAADDPFEVSDADTVLAWLDGKAAPSEKPPRAAFSG